MAQVKALIADAVSYINLARDDRLHCDAFVEAMIKVIDGCKDGLTLPEFRRALHSYLWQENWCLAREIPETAVSTQVDEFWIAASLRYEAANVAPWILTGTPDASDDPSTFGSPARSRLRKTGG